MNTKYYLYRHIRLDTNEVFYIGVGTKQKNKNTYSTIYKRAYNKTERSSFWTKVYNKCNKNIRVEILYETNCREELKNKEIEFITLYGRKNINTGTLVNLSEGGEGPNGCKPSKETIQKLRDSHIRIKNIKCIETGVIYNTVEDLCLKMFNKRYVGNIANCLNTNNNEISYKGYHFTTDLNINSTDDLSKKGKSRERKILCITTNIIYNSIRECCYALFKSISCDSNVNKAIKNNKKFNNLEFKYIT